MSIRDDILEKTTKTNKQLKNVYIPDWDKTVYFSPLTMVERAEIRKGAMSPNPGKPGELSLDFETLEVLTVLHKTLDENGGRIFQLSDREFLQKSASAAAITAISNAIHGRYMESAKNVLTGNRISS